MVPLTWLRSAFWGQCFVGELTKIAVQGEDEGTEKAEAPNPDSVAPEVTATA